MLPCVGIPREPVVSLAVPQLMFFLPGRSPPKIRSNLVPERDADRARSLQLPRTWSLGSRLGMHAKSAPSNPPVWTHSAAPAVGKRFYELEPTTAL
jgi:hypothetical protein